MKQEYNKMMEQLTLSPAAQASIEAGIRKAAPRRKTALRVAAALAACILLLCTVHPGLAQALEDTAERTIEWFRSTMTRGHGVTVLEDDYVYYNDGHMEIEVFKGSSVDTPHDSVLAPKPAWLREAEGRVYFLANMENRDITDLFSQEEPFLYTYDKDGITHYIAIGGNYDPAEGLDSVGYSEWLRRTDHVEDDGWLGGSGKGQYDPETDDYALWYAKAIVEMNIPWNYQSALMIVQNAQ